MSEKLFDIVTVKGNDHLDFLQGQITQNIEKLTAGAGKVKFWVDLFNRPVSGFLALIIFLVISITLFSYIYNYYH